MASPSGSVITRTEESGHARLRAVPIADVTLHDGLWQQRTAANRVHGIPRLLERMEGRGAVDNFRIGQPAQPDLARHGYWFSDSDVYKWIEAAAWSLAGHDDPEIERALDHVIDAVVGAQDHDGYLNTNFKGEQRLRDLGWSHELYCAGHLAQAAIATVRVSGDERLLDAATRFADYIEGQLRDRVDTDTHPGIEMALVELSRETGDARYSELASALCHRIDLGEQPQLWGHAVRSLYFACGLTDLAMETGDTAVVSTIDALWTSLRDEKSYVTGAVGGRWIGESFGRPFELPNESSYAETCGGIAVAMWAWRQLLRTGDAQYADHLEHVLHNAVLASVSLEGDEWFYANPLAFAAVHEHDPWGADRFAEDMAGPFPLRRRPWRDVTCCPTNAVRMLASLPGYVYAIDRTSNDLWINLFTPSTVDHGGWRVTQRTEYPWDGRVELAVERAPAGGHAIAVRIPGWCKALPAGAEGAAGALTPGTYSIVRRTWKPGDSVVLDLRMEPETIVCHPRVAENRGAVALQRGPLVFCLEGIDNPAVDVFETVVEPDTFQAVRRPDLLEGIVALEGRGTQPGGEWDGLYRRAGSLARAEQPVSLTAIPYFAWANRGLHPMTIWARSRLG